MAAKRKKSRSGTTWSEKHYRAAGYGTVKLRLPLEVLGHLNELAERLSTAGKPRTRQDAVRMLIAHAHMTHLRRLLRAASTAGNVERVAQLQRELKAAEALTK